MDRSLLDGVLAVVRELGAATAPDAALSIVTDALVTVLGFQAAAINVVTPEGDLRVDAAVGPQGVRDLLGTRHPMHEWLKLLDDAEPWGELRFYGHDRDQTPFERFPTWVPSRTAGTGPDAWHPDDLLLAPLRDERGRLVGVMSVDEPKTGRLPDQNQRTVLEVFAHQVAKSISVANSRQEADAARREVEGRWRLTFERSPTGAALLTEDGHILQTNEALTSLLGYPADELAQMTFAEITHPEDLDADLAEFAAVVDGSQDGYEIEKRYLCRDGSVMDGLLHVGAIREQDGSIRTIMGQVTDITARKQAQRQLAHQANHDALTGLPNHAHVAELLSHRLAAGEPTAVLFCDIDRFKIINTGLGRAAGDQLLALAAHRLLGSSPSGSTLARSGGNGYILVLPYADPALVSTTGERLMQAIRRPFALADGRQTVSISIGAAVAHADRIHADELIADAESALRRAKRFGAARIEFFDPACDGSETTEQLHLEQQLRAALEEDTGLHLLLQPIVDINDESVVGAEALIRWDHPERGLLQPAAFLPIAERSDLIADLGWRMLALGAQAAARLRANAGGTGWVAVNVSGNQLGRGRLVETVKSALTAHDLPGSALHLEITETTLVNASREAVDEIVEVANLGVSIALDDFGTGFSSLSLLRDLPISVVKIDRSFTAPIADNPRTAALVRGLVNMCNALNITTVAEGVETREQLAIMRALGCDHAQGFLFCQSQPALD